MLLHGIMWLSIFLTIIFLNIKAKNFVKKRAEERIYYPYEPLPDIVHQISPKIPLHIPDYTILITGVYATIQYFTLELDNLSLNCFAIKFECLAFFNHKSFVI